MPNEMDSSLFPLSLALLFVVAAAAIGTARLLRARRRARRRVIEQPNSHYTSRTVRQVETRHRWHDIPLDRIHEINRGEVERLLAKVEATSVDALSTREQAFLDRIAELTGVAPPPEQRDERQPAPELRHRPA